MLQVCLEISEGCSGHGHVEKSYSMRSWTEKDESVDSGKSWQTVKHEIAAVASALVGSSVMAICEKS